MGKSVSELEGILRNTRPLSSDWHSALKQYTEKVIELTGFIREWYDLRDKAMASGSSLPRYSKC